MHSSRERSSAISLRDSMSVPCDFIFPPKDHRAARLVVLQPAPCLCEKFVRRTILSTWSRRYRHGPLHLLVTRRPSYRSPRETEEFAPPAFRPCASSWDPDRDSAD